MVRAERRSRPLRQRARLRQGPLAVDGGSSLAIRGACLLRACGALASAIYLIEVAWHASVLHAGRAGRCLLWGRAYLIRGTPCRQICARRSQGHAVSAKRGGAPCWDACYWVCRCAHHWVA